MLPWSLECMYTEAAKYVTVLLGVRTIIIRSFVTEMVDLLVLLSNQIITSVA